MSINRKALFASLLAALPAPLLLAFVPAIFDSVEYHATEQGNLIAYLSSYILFVIVALIASRLATLDQGSPRSRNGSQSAPKAKTRAKAAKGSEEGEVKWFNVKKGFGFITRDSGGDVFVHFRAIQGEGRRVLRQGQRVRYTVVDAEKGLQANDVTILDDD